MNTASSCTAKRSGTWWPLLPLALYCALLLHGTLSPFRFTWHPKRDQMPPERAVEWIPFTKLCPNYGIFCPEDTGVNLAIFMPIGACVVLLPGGRWRLGRAAACGFFLSLGIETLQYFIPARFPSATDLVLNTLGAALGAWATVAASRFLTRKTKSPPLPPDRVA